MCTKTPPLRSVEKVKMYATYAINREFISTSKIDDHHKSEV